MKAGYDIASAAEETKKALKGYTDDLNKACRGNYVCEAKVARLYQAHAVKWTLSWDKNDSVVRKSIRNTICRYAPEAIINRLDLCIKFRKKKEIPLYKR